MSDINEIAKRENLTKEGKFAGAAQLFCRATNYKDFLVKIEEILVNSEGKNEIFDLCKACKTCQQ